VTRVESYLHRDLPRDATEETILGVEVSPADQVPAPAPAKETPSDVLPLEERIRRRA